MRSIYGERTVALWMYSRAAGGGGAEGMPNPAPIHDDGPGARVTGGGGGGGGGSGGGAATLQRTARGVGDVGLALNQFVIDAAARKQLVVRARLDDAALVHHQNERRVLDGREPVRNRDRRGVLKLAADRALNVHVW